MSRFSIWEGPPADAQTYKDLKWVVHRGDRIVLQMWSGRAKKPFVNGIIRNDEELEKYIAARKKDADDDETRKAERKATKAANRAKMKEEIKVGTLLCNSWGYEQTNCDFYQVVEKKGSVVMIRPIMGATVEGSTVSHGMADYRRAVPDSFIEGKEPIRKIIGPHGIAFEHGSASVTTPEEKHYCSWYA